MFWNDPCRPMLASFAIVSIFVCQTALAAGEILLGNIATTTNATARNNCINLVLGYTVFLEHVNRQGGVHGRKIKIVNKDDELNPEKMVALTESLIADKDVIALAGFLNTPGLIELAKKNLLGEKKIAMIAPIGAFNTTNFYPLRPGYNDETVKLLREAQDTQKRRVGIVYFNQAYGPSVFKFAQEKAREIGVNVVAATGFETAPDKIEAGIAAAAETLSKAQPDAVLMIVGGNAAYSFVKKFRQTENGSAQIYTLSTADPFLFVKSAGLENARGVVISQAMPYPGNNSLAVVREYQKMMEQYAPGQPLTFFSLEGFMGAKIAVEAIRRAGPNPTRAKVIAALNTMKDFDLGGVFVSYSPDTRAGSKTVDLTIIGKDGKLFR
ncbi:MAG TPA: ABC transporter substrate-binding protein [Burkholderiales bacterium]|nr:ABC transporter substrate-binding protein [Burkholderiales bacterium]